MPETELWVEVFKAREEYTVGWMVIEIETEIADTEMVEIEIDTEKGR